MRYEHKNEGYWNSSCHFYLHAFCEEMYRIDLYWRMGQEYDCDQYLNHESQSNSRMTERLT